MPGRAQLMTPGQAYEMGGSRFGVPLKVLTNKKALDMAIQKHIWTTQEQAQRLAGGMEKQELVGKQRLEQQELQNERYGKSSLESSVLSQAIKIAQSQLVEFDTPKGQAQFENIYRALLRQVKGGGAEELSTGQVPDLTQGIQAGTQAGQITQEEKPTRQSGTVLIELPDGRQGTIPRSKLKEAVKHGAKVIR